ncbi:MAG TPA: NAD(P)H-dependent oxidoreductase subunit E [Candidatus Omnitrophota bacterium]|mgnify:CR=1 FL=1|nr:NAD(P)H-dependent oxidoreductase subunit E [Candidatus Omnitrophota bacterium]HPS37678.1 NAD(P)H-dependent oxidoreductase subunit E [Candidatus Omnitrophota bacterium]
MNRKDIEQDIRNIAEPWRDKEGNLIMILHQIQNHYGYVPREVSLVLSEVLDVPLARIYEVITFYHFFRLTPPGKHTISVCMGTACYLKGGADLLSELEHLLCVKPGETTKDGQFHLEMVRCLGCCGLAPVLKINEKVYGGVKKKDLGDIIAEYSEEAETQAAA